VNGLLALRELRTDLAKMIRFDRVRSDGEREPPTRTRFRHVPSARHRHFAPPFAGLTNMDLHRLRVSSEEISRFCERFRVLIIGRRNAGKTTILEKMTGSEVGTKPEIRDEKGRLVVWSSLIYLTLIVKLMVLGRPSTCHARVRGPSSL
jgi:hypothetical protein